MEAALSPTEVLVCIRHGFPEQEVSAGEELREHFWGSADSCLRWQRLVHRQPQQAAEVGVVGVQAAFHTCVNVQLYLVQPSLLQIMVNMVVGTITLP